MSEIRAESPQLENSENKTPTKRTPSKRKSTLEKVRAESEEIIKSMGGSIDTEGKRRTRSSVKGPSAPATPVPPAKKPRTSGTPSRRGRPKREEIIDENEDSQEVSTPKKSEDKLDTVEEDSASVDSTKQSDAKLDSELNNDSEMEVDADKNDVAVKENDIEMKETTADEPAKTTTKESIPEKSENNTSSVNQSPLKNDTTKSGTIDKLDGTCVSKDKKSTTQEKDVNDDEKEATVAEEKIVENKKDDETKDELAKPVEVVAAAVAAAVITTASDDQIKEPVKITKSSSDVVESTNLVDKDVSSKLNEVQNSKDISIENKSEEKSEVGPPPSKENKVENDSNKTETLCGPQITTEPTPEIAATQ